MKTVANQVVALAKSGNILDKASFRANFIPPAKAVGNLKDKIGNIKEQNFATD